MTAEVSAATSKSDLVAEVKRLSALVDWHMKMGNRLLGYVDQDAEKIELLETENRVLWQQIEGRVA